MSFAVEIVLVEMGIGGKIKVTLLMVTCPPIHEPLAEPLSNRFGTVSKFKYKIFDNCTYMIQ
jgi:hypothetical protein